MISSQNLSETPAPSVVFPRLSHLNDRQPEVFDNSGQLVLTLYRKNGDSGAYWKTLGDFAAAARGPIELDDLLSLLDLGGFIQANSEQIKYQHDRTADIREKIKQRRPSSTAKQSNVARAAAIR
mmetsp:Transcript_55325/g.75606  ORF Transcript_55325/g.75606 Transcript_55325/m.75606 type:complete len:124 (-) Transcript_55325:895-1266(-)